MISTTNIAWLMQQAGVGSYEALHAWSVRNRESFWELAIGRLGLSFQRPFRCVMDLTHGVEAPRWLVDAQLNIVESCFRAPADWPAIYYQAEGGALAAVTVGELQALTERVAANLSRIGFQPGDALAIIMPMTAESVAIYLGIIKAGCVVVGIADSFQPREIAARLRLAHTAGVFTQDVSLRSGRTLPLYENIIQAGAPPAIVLPAHERLSLPLRTGDCAWPDFLSDAGPFEAAMREPSDPINILFS
jgi:acetyl-CoA synthetase